MLETGEKRGTPKSKSQNEILGFRGRDSRETLTECKLLFCKEIWLEWRNSNSEQGVFRMW